MLLDIFIVLFYLVFIKVFDGDIKFICIMDYFGLNII